MRMQASKAKYRPMERPRYKIAISYQAATQLSGQLNLREQERSLSNFSAYFAAKILNFRVSEREPRRMNLSPGSESSWVGQGSSAAQPPLRGVFKESYSTGYDIKSHKKTYKLKKLWCKFFSAVSSSHAWTSLSGGF